MLSGDDVALKIQADVYRFSVPHSGAAPDALVVLFQAANIAEALRLDARLGLTFGEAVRAGDRRPGIISVFAERLDKLIIEAVSKEPSKRDAAKEQDVRNRLRLIASERAQIETTLYQRFPDYAALAKPAPLSVQETQQLLADDEILIVFDFDRQSYAGVFSHSQAGSFVLQITAADLEAQVKALRVSLTYAPQFDVEASYRLYQSLFGPYAEYIASKTRLTVVANGALTSFRCSCWSQRTPRVKSSLTSIGWFANMPSLWCPQRQA